MFTVSCKFTTLSQPTALVVVKVWFPDVKYVEPFHTKLSHAVTGDSVEELELFIVRSKFTVLSHPLTADKIRVFIPPEMYVCPLTDHV